MFPQNMAKAKERAFTLVEITLALGIVAFAVILSFGLLSTATQSFGDTRRDTVYANILQYATANANLTPFAELIDPQNPDLQLDGKQWGFDAEGLRDDVPPRRDAQSIYYAQITVTDPPILPAQVALAAGTKSVNVKITDAGTKTAHAVTYHVLVGNLAK